jgi:hypothetical protein
VERWWREEGKRAICRLDVSLQEGWWKRVERWWRETGNRAICRLGVSLQEG